MSYKLQINWTVGGKCFTKNFTSETKEEAIKMFDENIKKAEENFGAEMMRNIGADCTIFLMQFENMVGESTIADARIKRPLHSPKEQTFIHRYYE